MKKYVVCWGQPYNDGDPHLMNNYDCDGNVVNNIGQEPFLTLSEEIARRVYDSELTFAESEFPKLSSFPWADDLSDNDTAWANVWALALQTWDFDENGVMESVSNLLLSDYFFNG